MIAPLARALLVAASLASGAAIIAGLRSRPVQSDPGNQATEKSASVEKATRLFLNCVLLPVWVIPGFFDYLCHRASKIERTSGTHESLTHALMISSTGAGIAAAMFFEVNELVLAIMAAAALTHEGIVIWDVGYAANLRRVSPFEMHVHGFLEVLPFTGLAFAICLNPDDLAVLLGRGKRPRTFRFERKRNPVSPAYVASIFAITTAMLVIPYAEELLRCYRVDHTFSPHPTPIDPPPLSSQS